MTTVGHVDLAVDISQADVLRKSAIQCCHALFQDWAGLSTVENVQITEISGGITNKLWKVFVPSEPNLQPLLLRVYGDNTENFIDRKRELFLLNKLTQHGFGAPVLGTFTNGRFEQFLQVHALEAHELSFPAVARSVARRLAQFHQIDPGMERIPTLFETIWKWFGIAESLDFSCDESQQTLFHALNLPAKRESAAQLQSLCEAFGSPVVFGHNDLLSGNVLIPIELHLDPAEEAACIPVQFIDFEYGAFSYRGFDWGNHFNEYAGFECVWEQYPDQQHAERFVTAYLQEATGQEEVDGQVVQRCVVEANLFSLVSHVYWGVWAVLQAKWSKVDFNYLAYSHKRWERYADTRNNFIAAAEKFL